MSRKHAAGYLRRGWMPIPVKFKSKNPGFSNWPSFKTTSESLDKDFPEIGNVGVLLGEPSNWLIDVDLDCAETIELAPHFLHDTAIFGRLSKLKSHWLFHSPGCETKKWVADGITFVEIRSTGSQTVFPGSVHPSGESIQWESGELNEISKEDLVKSVHALAVAALLKRRGLSSPTPDVQPIINGWLGASMSIVTTDREINPLVEAFNLANQIILPKSLGECPMCGHHECFGQLAGNAQRWACFSASHTDYGIKGNNVWTGDALDIKAKLARVRPLEYILSQDPLTVEDNLRAWFQSKNESKALLMPVVKALRSLQYIDPLIRGQVDRNAKGWLKISSRELSLPAAKIVKITNNFQTENSVDLDKSASGALLDNLNNITQILESESERVWYDTFLQKIITDRGMWCDELATDFSVDFQRRIGLKKISTKLVEEAVIAYAKKNPRNELEDYLNGLIWDGIDRLSTYMQTAFKAEDSAYMKAVSVNFWRSMVARGLQPGCKVDTMIVLEGGQGAFKSTALAYIAGAWFAESSRDPHDKDFFMGLRGKLLVEIGELDSFKRADVTAVKRVLSCRIDEYREPYGRQIKAFPRQGIFAGSTNRDDWARDPTGARRFLPVECHSVDLDFVRSTRDQCFAQAVVEVRAGQSWWQFPIEETEAHQAARRAPDAWDDEVIRLTEGKNEVRPEDVYADIVPLVSERVNSDLNRIRDILRWLGFKRGAKRYGDVVKKMWLRKNSR